MAKVERGRRRGQDIFGPGELVCCWRHGRGRGTRPGSMHGSWIGPGEVLGTNTQLDDGGQRSGSRVYVILNGKILCCAPCQLRRASARESGEYQLGTGGPWTFGGLLQRIDQGEIEDIVGELDSDNEPARRGETREREERPGRRRLRRKVHRDDEEMEDMFFSGERSFKAVEGVLSAELFRQ